MHAVLLAGGLGTRLRAVVADRPKVMADIGGRPFLALLLDYLARQGLNRVTLAVGYRHDDIVSYFGARHAGLDIDYSIEHDPLGTGGAVRRALPLAASEPSFVINGDTWLELDYRAMRAAHDRADARLTMALRRLPDVGRYGALDVEAGYVRGFYEKGRTGDGLINAGVYLLRADVFDGLDLPARFSIETDFLMPHVARLRPLAFEARGDFIDIGIPDDYARAQHLLARRG